MTDDRTGGTGENAHTTQSTPTAHPTNTPSSTFPSVPDRDVISLDADRALAPHRMMPPPAEIADLTVRLISHGARLVAVVETIPESEHSVRAKGALKDWYDLTDGGPGEGAMANWVHMRAMARMCRTFMDYLGERDRERQRDGRRRT
ncbi:MULTISPECIES: DUF6415 family natural product biosynthesis protein [unclassified Streptomyces]|uniref:DUF6415 family natural product biosynthesis protein n=1 Tax=unclassified Streptomyces TaxID=2593676 RepID=UPI002E2D7E95|nr:DUF6415 family natural product biosynthesis protein [Streptomyces sp. NBC_01429]